MKPLPRRLEEAKASYEFEKEFKDFCNKFTPELLDEMMDNAIKFAKKKNETAYLND